MATLRNVFHDIAESIRAKGVSGTMKPIEMAQKIGEIQTGGSQDYGYLTFTAVENITLTLKQNGNIAPHKLLKSSDGINWTKWENPSTNGIVLNSGESVYLKADEDASNRTGGGYYDYNRFLYEPSFKPIKCYGDIRSIVKITAPADYSYWFSSLFANMRITNAPELKSTTLVPYCYKGMFYSTSLTSVPELPAITLAEGCYSSMFHSCMALTSVPELPAITLAEGCYSSMFGNCQSLTTAPSVLPATTLTQSCYQSMFDNCRALTSAPELPATTLANNCCYSMFSNCTSLTTAPELPATTLANYCYSAMFRYCTSLKRIKMNASSGNWGQQMFEGCTSLELVDMTGSIGVPQLENVNNFSDTNSTYKIVVPDSLYDTWIAATNWASIASHIMKQTDWNAAHPDDILGQ